METDLQTIIPNKMSQKNEVVTQQTLCACARKLTKKEISSTKVMEPDNDSNFNMIINCEIFKNLIQSFMKCQSVCDSDIVFSIDITKRMGLCNTIDPKCGCNWKYSLETSYQSSKLNSKNVRKFYEINIQSVIAFCKIGKGLEGISSFCRSTDMPPPLAKKLYNRINDVLHQVYCEVASNNVLYSANEIHSLVKKGRKL